MSNFIGNLIYNFLIAFGVVVGASLCAGLGALLNNHPPIKAMLNISSSIKIWAVAVALGGTVTSFEAIEKGILRGEIRSVVKQVSYVIIALIGANVGYGFIKIIQRCGRLWME